MAVPHAPRPVSRPARLRVAAGYSSLTLSSRLASVLRREIAPPQIGTPLAGQPLRLRAPPLPDLRVVAGHQHLRHRPAFPDLRPRIMRIFEQPRGKTLFFQGLGASDDPRQ